MQRSGVTRVIIALTSVFLACVAHTQEEEPMIEPGKTVAFEFTLKLDDGSVVQSNKGSEPLTYVHGQNQILPALEQQLERIGVAATGGAQQRVVHLDREGEDALGHVVEYKGTYSQYLVAREKVAREQVQGAESDQSDRRRIAAAVAAAKGRA